MTGRIFLQITPLLGFVFASIAQAAILKDHVTNAVNFDGEFYATQGYDDQNVGERGGLASTFIGDGRVLKSVTGVFGSESREGIPNEGSPQSLDFRLIFHESTASYSDDPFGLNPGSGDFVATFDNVSNLNTWLIPVGESQDGHHLFEWTFDIEALGIKTMVGAEHVISILADGNFTSGPAILQLSNGQDAIGSTEDWFTNTQLGPAPLSTLNAPQNFAAYRVVSVVPEGDSICILLIGLAAFSIQYTRIHHRTHSADNHSTEAQRCK